MASLIGSMFVSLTADFQPFQRNMRTAEGVVSSSAGRMRREMGMTADSANRLRGAFNQSYRSRLFGDSLRTITRTNDEVQRLRAAFVALSAVTGAGFTGALSGAYLIQTADRARLLNNQLRTVTDSSENLYAIQDRLFDISQRTRSSLQATTTIYARTARATESFGMSQEKLLRITETIQKAFAVGGATTQEAWGAAVQLSQGIASDRFSGEEFRSVAENAPVLLRGIAESLGVNIGKLREMAHAGELTAKTVTEAILNASKRIDEEFDKTSATVGQAITRLDNAFLQYMGGVDAAYGVTTGLSDAITNLAANFESVAYWAGLALGGGIAAFVGRSAGNFTKARIASVRNENAARKENLRLAREEFAQAKRNQQAAAAELARARSTPEGGVSSLAPRAMHSAVAREEAALARLDRQRLENIDKQIKARQNLQSVTVQTSRTAVRAAEASIASEAKLVGMRQRLIGIEKEEAIARRRASVQFTVSTPGMEAVELKKRGERDLARLTTERARLEASMGKQEEDLARRRAAFVASGTEAERKAAEQRLGYRRQIIALDQQSVDIARQMDAQRGRVAGARQEVVGAGQQIHARGIADAARASDAAASASQRARMEMLAASRAAGTFAVAGGLLRGALGSLVGFLGGPWGVAFTAAVGALTYFSMRSRRTAMEIAETQRIIAEALDEIQTRPGTQTRDQQLSVIGLEIEAQTNKLEIVTKALNEARSKVVDALYGLLADPRVSALPNANEVEQRIVDLARRFGEADISIGELLASLRELPVRAEAIDAVAREFETTREEVRRAEVAVDHFTEKVDRLNGRKVMLEVGIEVSDPWNLLTGHSQLIPRLMEDEINQRRQYGQGQRRAQEEMRRVEEIRRALARARQDPKQALEDRTLDVLRDGLVKTRPEAEKLAAELIRLEEAAKKSGRGADSAAKNYENFANKIKELREQASAAFLSDIDRQVVDFAKSLKDGSAMMAQYIAAINSGDLSQAPDELLQVRDALMQIGAADTWRGIIQQYGTGAQLATQFAEKQAQLNYLVAEGKITAEQAGLAYADFVGQFKEHAWINQMSDAIGNFVESAIMNFDDLKGATASLLKELMRIGLQIAIIEPFKDSFKSWAAPASVSGGGLFGAVGSFFANIFHSGTMNAQPGGGPGKMVPASAFAGAPRFHRGNLNGREMAAIIERGEAVLQQRTANKISGVVSGLTSRIAGSDGTRVYDRPTNVNVQIVTPNPQAFAQSRGQIESSMTRAVARGQRGL